MVSSLSLAEFYSPFVFGSDIIPPRTASLTFYGEPSVPPTPTKLPQSTQCWLLSLDSWHSGPCLAYSRRSIDAGGTGHLGALARCSRELCPAPCRGGCADPSEARGCGFRREMARCTGRRLPHLITRSRGSTRGRGGNETQLARKEARKSSLPNRKQGGGLEAELPGEWEGGNLALLAGCPALLRPQHRGAGAPRPAGRCPCESSPQALTSGPQGRVRRLCDSLWFAHGDLTRKPQVKTATQLADRQQSHLQRGWEGPEGKCREVLGRGGLA